ncbi:MAG: glycosyltransferase family 2 protein [Propionibacteriaceae bacterium]|nr:glycosyltransferase family 2 protein [Propionibacteriaceae bacterium]
MENRTVAYLIVTWNNADIIAGCIDSIFAQAGVKSDVYVLDNDSSDDTITQVRKYRKVHLLKSTRNLGFAKGNNVLIRHALRNPDVQWVALINSDAVLDTQWTRNILDYVDGKPSVAAAQGLTLDYYDHHIVDSRHIYVSKRLQGIQYGYTELVDHEAYYPRKVFGVNAAAAMFSRDFIEHQPDPDSYFFDERFYMYYEDVDVAYRALVAGYDSFFVPTAVAYHMGSVSAKKNMKMYPVIMTARNHLAVVYKNTPWRLIFLSMPELLKGIKDFLQQVKHDHGVKGMRKVLGTYVIGLLRLPMYARSRREIRKHTRLGSNYMMVVMRQEGIR